MIVRSKTSRPKPKVTAFNNCYAKNAISGKYETELAHFQRSIMSGCVDRHRGARTFTSGAAKRKAAEEKKEKQAKELAKMARTTDIMKSSVDTPKSLGLVREDSKDTESEIDIQNVESSQSDQIGLLLLGTSAMTTERQCDSPESTNAQNTDVSKFQTLSLAHTSSTENDIGKWPDHLTKSVE